VLLPLLVLLGAWTGSQLSVPFSRMHRTVALAERLVLDDGPKDPGSVDATVAFRGTGRPVEDVYKEALAIRGRFAFGSSVFGGFIGLVVGMKLIGAALRRRRKEFEIVRSACLACGRCFLYCPKEHVRRKETGAEVPPEAVSGQM